MGETKPTLDRCPRCDYSLAGLPAEHACPECGLRYDSQSEAWRGRMPWAWFGWLWSVPAGLLALSFFLRAFSHPSMEARAMLWASLAALIAALLWFVLRSLRLIRLGPRAALLPDGIFVRTARPQGEMIPWSLVLWANGERRRRATLMLRGAMASRTVGDVFASQAEVDRFVDAVKRRLAARENVEPSSDQSTTDKPPSTISPCSTAARSAITP